MCRLCLCKIPLITLQTTVSSQQSTINQCCTHQSDLTNQKNSINYLQSRVTSLTNEAATLKTDVAELRHVEQGVLDCQRSSSWSDGYVPHPGGYYDHYDISRQLSHSFSKVYSSPPVVFLSTSYRFISKDNNVYYGTKLVHVTTSGFSMLCGGDSDDDDVLRDMEVDWISIPV